LLESLYGIDSINSNTIANLYLTSNNLSHCAVASICNYLANPNGEIEIHGNSEGCNSPSEVENICTVDIRENQFITQIDAYPNPVKDILHLSYPMSEFQYKIEIINVFGQTVFETNTPVQQSEISLDLSPLPPGFYTIVFSDKMQLVVKKKLVIQ
jgi:hypothetical protein